MLDTGIKAPEFAMPDNDGKIHKLEDYKGKKVVLYFYPKDLTPGCTTEACDFRDAAPNFGGVDAVVLGVSKDPVAKHQKFLDKHELNFPLLSDEEGTVCEDYHVWKEKNMYGRKYMGIERTTFIIDEEGVIRKIYPKVKVKGHVEQVLADLKEL